MPDLSEDDIDGLQRTFSMYVRMSKDEWPRIQQAESLTQEGNRIYEELVEEFRNEYVWDGV